MVGLVVACCAVCGQGSQALPEFVVASIKPSAPYTGQTVSGGCTGGPGTSDPGLLTCKNLTLYSYVAMAYDIQRFQYAGPDWLESVGFDVTAKIPPETTLSQCKQMVQSLLRDRFKLVVHRQPKELPGYDLVVAKNGPKFKESDAEAGKADPFLPPTWQPGGGMRMHSPQATMQQFINLLLPFVGAPVTDLTGLKGTYQFSLAWMPDRTTMAARDSTPDLMLAMEEQLGLKLTKKKDSVDMLVIDHIEKTPTEN
jgi:uncharacterized protein (TIGR03435 family)